jgi:hypothetical protein
MRKVLNGVMNANRYPAARAAAIAVLPHFVRRLSSASGTASVSPDIDTVESLIDVAFWASLRREEGYMPKISLVFIDPDRVDNALRLERPIPLGSQPLTRLAPAVERPGIHLGVWPDEGTLHVWGTIRALPDFCFVLEVIAPGHLVVKQSRGHDATKFVNVAVLEGEQIKVIDEHAAAEPDCPALLRSLMGLDAQFSASDSLNVLILLAESMRAHGRGGSLLVVPAAAEMWRDSILHPVTYSVTPAFSALADLTQVGEEEKTRLRWRGAMRDAIDGVAGLTAVDGATIINDNYEVLAFGAKIIRRPGCAQVDKVMLTEPIAGSAAVIEEPALIGGTRHLSAAQFVHDQRQSIALVASQDGRFTVFGWSSCEDLVHAHRIEALLL